MSATPEERAEYLYHRRCEWVLPEQMVAAMATEIRAAEATAVAAEREKFRCPICKHEPGCSPTVVCEGCFAERIEEVRNEAQERVEASKILCQIYFEIAAEAIGEDEVRSRRDAAIERHGGES